MDVRAVACPICWLCFARVDSKFKIGVAWFDRRVCTNVVCGTSSSLEAAGQGFLLCLSRCIYAGRLTTAERSGTLQALRGNFPMDIAETYMRLALDQVMSLSVKSIMHQQRSEVTRVRSEVTRVRPIDPFIVSPRHALHVRRKRRCWKERSRWAVL